MAKRLPPRSLLLERLEYFPETGKVLWKCPSSKARGVKPGQEFGRMKVEGKTRHYTRYGRVNNVEWPVARLIWRMQTGKDPKDKFVWHKDRDRTNNRWDNLILITRTEMNLLSETTRGSRTPYKGVYWVERLQAWCAYAQIGKSRMYVGTFKTPKEAYQRILEYLVRFSRPEIASLLRDHPCLG